MLSEVNIEAEIEDKLKVEKYMGFLNAKFKAGTKTTSNNPQLMPVILDFSNR